jgi:hypothetical protein
MGVTAVTKFNVTCDYCHGTIVEWDVDASQVVSIALARANHRFDPLRGPGDQWECRECQAKRTLRGEAQERNRAAVAEDLS